MSGEYRGCRCDETKTRKVRRRSGLSLAFRELDSVSVESPTLEQIPVRSKIARTALADQALVEAEALIRLVVDVCFPRSIPSHTSYTMGPSSTNKPYAEASHPANGDGVPAKATSKPTTDKHEALRSLHRDPSMSDEAIHNRATSGHKGSSGTRQNQGQTVGSVKANHGAGGPGNHPTESGNYADGSNSMADQVRTFRCT